jgi:hypothetical protein
LPAENVVASGTTYGIGGNGSTGTGNVVYPPPSPGQTTAFLTCYDGNGNTKPGATLSFAVVNPSDPSNAYSQTPVTATSNSSGLVQVTLRRLTNYTATAPSGQPVDFTTSNTSTFALPSLLGQF